MGIFGMTGLTDQEAKRRIDAAETESEVKAVLDKYGRGWDSAIGLYAKQKIGALRHADMKPGPWWKQPATWIAIVIALIGWALLFLI